MRRNTARQKQSQASIYEDKTPAQKLEPSMAAAVHPVPQLRPGWSRPQPEHIPAPTYAPSIMALGIVFILWGIITSPLITVIGLVLLFIALAGWIGELRHGH